MKEFFQKKSVAITITLVVIALAVVIGAVSAPKGAQTQSQRLSERRCVRLGKEELRAV